MTTNFKNPNIAPPLAVEAQQGLSAYSYKVVATAAVGLAAPPMQAPNPIIVNWSVAQPVYCDTDVPSYYNRAKTVYGDVPIEDLMSRDFNSHDLRSLVKFLPDGVVVAGGSVSSTLSGASTPSDIDMFFESAAAFEDTFRLLLSPPETEEAWAWHGYTCEYTLDEVRAHGKEMRYVKFTHPDPSRLPIQLIKMVWFENPKHTLDSFDFTVTQFGLTRTHFHFNPLGLIDLYKKKLVVHKIQCPATSLRRLIKYTNKGFYAGPEVLLKIAEGIKDASMMTDPDLPIHPSAY